MERWAIRWVLVLKLTYIFSEIFWFNNFRRWAGPSRIEQNMIFFLMKLRIPIEQIRKRETCNIQYNRQLKQSFGNNEKSWNMNIVYARSSKKWEMCIHSKKCAYTVRSNLLEWIYNLNLRKTACILSLYKRQNNSTIRYVSIISHHLLFDPISPKSIC